MEFEEAYVERDLNRVGRGADPTRLTERRNIS
jgi:hypothetical protein